MTFETAVAFRERLNAVTHDAPMELLLHVRGSYHPDLWVIPYLEDKESPAQFLETTRQNYGRMMYLADGYGDGAYTEAPRLWLFGVIAALTDKDTRHRMHAVELFNEHITGGVSSTHKDLIDGLSRDLVHDPSPKVRSYVATGSLFHQGNKPNPRTRDLARALLTDEEPSVRRTAYRNGLVRDADGEVGEFDPTRDPAAIVRIDAIKFGYLLSAEAGVRLAEDPNADVRLTLVRKFKLSTETLARLADDPHPTVAEIAREKWLATLGANVGD